MSTCVYCEFKVQCVIQRIGGHTRMGGPEQLQVQRFCEAAYDPSTGLTSIKRTASVLRSVSFRGMFSAIASHSELACRSLIN